MSAPALIFSVCLLVFFPGEIKSQEKVQIFGNIDFNKALPERINDYLKLESEMWKPIQEEHIRQGGIIGWNVFRVWFAGTGSEYNYAVMETYRNYSDMAFVYSDDIITKVHPGINEAKLMDDTYHAREIVRAQSVERIAALRPDTVKKPSQYVVVTYLAVKKDNISAFEKDANDLILQAFRERMKSGMNEGWDLYKLVLPGGETMPCQYISFEYITGMDQAVKATWPDPLPGIQPCTVYRTELWERLVYLPEM
jgi:hypothetical protein